MLDVNVRGVLHGIAAALPLMRVQGGGHFVNIASVGAYEVSPTAAVYCATKFAVRALFRRAAPGIRRRPVAVPAAAIADAIAYAIDRPADVDVNELVVRPSASARKGPASVPQAGWVSRTKRSESA